MSKFKVGDIVTGKYKHHWIYGSKWKIKDVKTEKHPTLGDYDLYEVEYVAEHDLKAGAIWKESELKLVEEGQEQEKQNTFKIKDIINKLNIGKGKYISDGGIEIEITEDTVILGNKHNNEFVVPIDFNDTFKEDSIIYLEIEEEVGKFGHNATELMDIYNKIK